MTSISSSLATPSATYRVTSAATVNVLPVPALASSRVVPVGSGSRMSKARMGVVSGTAVTSSPCSASSNGLHRRRARAPNRVVSPGCSSPGPGFWSRPGNGAFGPHTRTWAASEHSPGNMPSLQSKPALRTASAWVARVLRIRA